MSSAYTKGYNQRCKTCGRGIQWAGGLPTEKGERHYCHFYDWIKSFNCLDRKGKVKHPIMALLRTIENMMTDEEKKRLLYDLKSNDSLPWKYWNRLWNSIIVTRELDNER